MKKTIAVFLFAILLISGVIASNFSNKTNQPPMQSNETRPTLYDKNKSPIDEDANSVVDNATNQNPRRNNEEKPSLYRERKIYNKTYTKIKVEQFRQKIMNRIHKMYGENGSEIRIRMINKTIIIQTKNISAKSKLNFSEEKQGNQTRLKAYLSNGKNALIKVMPDRASKTALARLRLKVCNESNNCTIELKEVGKGNKTRAAYEIRVEKRAKILGIFKRKMKIRTQVDAENGEIVQIKRPWWNFLAKEIDEEAN